MKDPRFLTSYRGYDERPPAPEGVDKARALAKQTALAEPGIELLEQASERLGRVPAGIWPAFFEGFAAAVRGNEERRRAWVELLRAEVEKAAGDPGALLLSRSLDEGGLNAAARAWREESNPLSVWDRRREPHMPLRGDALFFDLHLLLALDQVAWCEAVDGLPWPGLMTTALFLARLTEDRELLLELLRVAPPVFGPDGRWVASRSVVALLLTDQIVQHARALHEAVSYRARVLSTDEQDAPDGASTGSELRALEGEEIPRWMRQAFTVLVMRPDGRPLALALLERLARAQILGRRNYHEQTFWAEQEALHQLAAVLRDAGLGVRDIRDAWLVEEARAREEDARRRSGDRARSAHSRREGEGLGEGARTLRGEGLPFLVGAAALLGEDPGSPDELDVLWGWFDELLTGRDPGLPFLRYGSSLEDVPQRIGWLLSRSRAPGALLRGTYLRLEPQRRRASFSYRYEDYDHDLGSALLVQVGLYAAVNWGAQEGGEGREPARELFWWLYEAARRLWLTALDRHEDERRDLVTLAFAFMPALFGDALGDALRRAVPPIAGEERMVCDAAWFLWRNSVTPDRLPRLLRDAGADLETALRDAHQWAELTDDRNGRRHEADENRAFPAALEDLAAALRLSFDEPADALPETERTRRRGELARTIPWGAVLLERLERDGCALSRLDPLDAAGVTWLLQASVPDALRARFGLSPEIRVLVVHGQVRGRELRIALQDPRDAAAIDPDLIVVASDQPDLARRLPMLAGPFGQRVPWAPAEGQLAPLAEALREHLPGFDLFDYRDPVRGTALIGREAEVDDLAARLLRGEAVGVVGLRKVGKSSLLRAVAERLDPIGARRGMFESLTVPLPDAQPEALVVSLDVQGVAGRGLSVLLDRLGDVLEDRLARAGITDAGEARGGTSAGGALPASQIRVAHDAGREPIRRAVPEAAALDPMDRFRALLKRALDRAAVPVCLMLDEYDLLFEGYGGEPGIAGVEQLLSVLRAEAQATRRVSLALIGRDPSFLDRPLLGGFTSPLAGWAKHVYLGPLRREGMEELLTRLGRRVGLDVGPATLADAWLWTGGHPLLARQYGAALFDLAHAPPSRPLPVPTDPICADAGEVFLGRAAVQTICTEVRALLEARYPEALALIGDLARAPAAQAGTVVLRHGGTRASAAQVLERFGLLKEENGGRWIPGAFREAFAASAGGPQSMNRSAAR